MSVILRNESHLSSYAKIDVCVFTFSMDGVVVGSQITEFKRTLSRYPLTFEHFSFVCETCPVGYNFLPEKTYRWLQLVANGPCVSAIKVDVDGMFCFNNARIPKPILPFVYAGVLNKFGMIKTEKLRRAYNAARYDRQKKNGTEGVRVFMVGGAYMIGREVAKFATSIPFHHLVNTGFEDVNLAIHTNAMRARARVSLRGSDARCAYNRSWSVLHRCEVFEGVCGKNQ